MNQSSLESSFKKSGNETCSTISVDNNSPKINCVFELNKVTNLLKCSDVFESFDGAVDGVLCRRFDHLVQNL